MISRAKRIKFKFKLFSLLGIMMLSTSWLLTLKDNTLPSSSNSPKEIAPETQSPRPPQRTKIPLIILSKKQPNLKNPPLTAKQEQAMTTALKQINFQGTATVYKNGHEVWHYGNNDAAYLINSLQKMLTAGLLMQQVAVGKLNLQQKLSDFYPQAPNAQNITLMQLLEMTSGYTPKVPLGKNPFISDDDNLQYALQNTTFDPNLYGKWNYQSLNYVILSNILAKVTGKSYQDLFNQEYTYPLKLKSTAFIWEDQNVLRGINLAPNAANNTYNFDLPELHGELGAGSVAMSNNDLYRVVKGLLDGQLLNEADKNLIFGPGNNPPHYRGGVYSKNGYYSADGAGDNYLSFLRIAKDGQSGVILQTQPPYAAYNQVSDTALKLYQIENQR